MRIRQDADAAAAQPRDGRASGGSAADVAAAAAGGVAHDGAVHNDAMHDETVHDGAVNDNAVHDNAVDDEALDGDAVNSDALDDDVVHDNAAGAASGGEVCVVMPTYNERENIGPTLAALFARNPEVHVLVVDDASPDGTGEAAEALAAGEPRLHVLHREGKNGLGPAYLAGFDWALKRGYATLCSMDMDGSHRAQDLHAMLRVLADNPHVDLVIGSRRVPGGRTDGWSRHRNWISSTGSWYARTMLGLGVRDMTSGLRAYRAGILRASNLRSVEANGYVFQIDMTRRVAAAGGSIVEVPIVFPERVHGRSKMGMGIVVEAMQRVTGWGLRRLFGRS